MRNCVKSFPIPRWSLFAETAIWETSFFFLPGYLPPKLTSKTMNLASINVLIRNALREICFFFFLFFFFSLFFFFLFCFVVFVTGNKFSSTVTKQSFPINDYISDKTDWLIYLIICKKNAKCNTLVKQLNTSKKVTQLVLYAYSIKTINYCSNVITAWRRKLNHNNFDTSFVKIDQVLIILWRFKGEKYPFPLLQ